MPSRRALLATLGSAAAVGTAGCIGGIRRELSGYTPIDGPCDEPTGTWPTAGGDAGRTGRTDTAPPAPDAALMDPLAGARDDEGWQLHAHDFPAVADGTAYVPVDGGIAAVDLDAPTDGVLWYHYLGDGINATPALACGAVFAPGKNRLVALDPLSGERFWHADAGSAFETVTMAPLEDTVYVTGFGPVAVDVRTGSIQWSVDGGSTLALDDAGLYTTSDGRYTTTAGIYAHGLDGEERWHLSLGTIDGPASVLDGTVWVADHDGTVYAIDAGSGETYWSRSPPGVGKNVAGLAVTGDEVIVPAGGGTTSVALDAATGEPIWAVDTGAVITRPVVGDDWVAFAGTDEGVSLYDLETGAERTTWSVAEYDFGTTIGGLVPVEKGFLIRAGFSSGIKLLR